MACLFPGGAICGISASFLWTAQVVLFALHGGFDVQWTEGVHWISYLRTTVFRHEIFCWSKHIMSLREPIRGLDFNWCFECQTRCRSYLANMSRIERKKWCLCTALLSSHLRTHHYAPLVQNIWGLVNLTYRVHMSLKTGNYTTRRRWVHLGFALCVCVIVQRGWEECCRE